MEPKKKKSGCSGYSVAQDVTLRDDTVNKEHVFAFGNTDM